MSPLDIGEFNGERKESMLRNPEIFRATQTARTTLERIYRNFDDLKAFEQFNKTKKKPGAISLDKKYGMVRRDAVRLWAQITHCINKIPNGDLGADQQSVDILFWQINQALEELRRVSLPSSEIRDILEGFLDGDIERGSVSVPVAKKVKRKVKKTMAPKTKPEPVSPPKDEKTVVPIIELPAEAFADSAPVKEEPKSRAVGTNHLRQEDMGHYGEFEQLITGGGKHLFGALKKKVRQMREQQGYKADDVVKIIHALSDGEQSKIGTDLGRLIVDLYKGATEQGQQAIRIYVDDEYRAGNMRGSIKNPLANFKMKGGNGKDSDYYPFETLRDNHSTSADAQKARVASIAGSVPSRGADRFAAGKLGVKA